MEIIGVALISSVIGPTVLWFLQRQTRREEKADRALVAAQVVEVATKAAKVADKVEEVATKVDTAAVVMTSANADRMASLDRIDSTVAATHQLVNSDHTRQLRVFAAILTRTAKDYPDDLVLAKEAADAEDELAANVAFNADPLTQPRRRSADRE